MRNLVDPRPDLADDHLLWVTVLDVAQKKSNAQGEPALTLEGLRCLGAELVLRDGVLRISQGREIDALEYKGIRSRWLMPYRGTIVTILSTAESLLPEQVRLL